MHTQNKAPKKKIKMLFLLFENQIGNIEISITKNAKIKLTNDTYFSYIRAHTT